MLQARIGRYDLNDLLQTYLGRDDIKRFSIPKFYKELLREFHTFCQRPIEDKMDVQKERLWYNRSVRVGGKTIFVNNMYQAGINMIDDLTDEDGRFLSLAELKNRAPSIKVDVLTYQRILQGIPQMWKEKLVTGRTKKISDQSERMAIFPIGAKMLKINEMRSFHFYKAFIGQETPRAVKRWEFYEYNVSSWKKVFRIPYICTKSTKLQTLQYRILHRYIPTRRYLL